MNWFKWHNGTISDPKFRTISRKSDIPVATLVAVWAALLEHANSLPEDKDAIYEAYQKDCNVTERYEMLQTLQSPRGTIADFSAEDCDVNLGLPDGETAKIIGHFIERNLIKNNRISSWYKRQMGDETPQFIRTRKSRENSKAKKKDVTLRNVTKRSVTLDKNRTEKKNIKDFVINKTAPPLIHKTYPQSHENQDIEDENQIPDHSWLNNKIFNPTNSKAAWLLSDEQTADLLKKLDQSRVRFPRMTTQIVDEIVYSVLIGEFKQTRWKDGIEKAINSAIKFIKSGGEWTVPRGYHETDPEYVRELMQLENST